jgi:hypothetical protein
VWVLPQPASAGEDRPYLVHSWPGICGRTGPEKFNAKDPRREIGGPLREASPMDEACAALVEAGLIRPRPERGGHNPGRMAKNYQVNPAVLP